MTSARTDAMSVCWSAPSTRARPSSTSSSKLCLNEIGSSLLAGFAESGRSQNSTDNAPCQALKFSRVLGSSSNQQLAAAQGSSLSPLMKKGSISLYPGSSACNPKTRLYAASCVRLLDA